MSILTLLTDFGTTDYYVGAVKGTVLRLLGPVSDDAPRVVLVDLSHDLPPGDVEAAADLLAGAAPAFPKGTVHLAVVDPGVGGERRILAARVDGHLYVAPDNGLLTPVLGPDAEVRSVTRTDLFLAGPGATFHGRDRFAPTAAALLKGEPLDSLGPEIDDPTLLDRPHPRRLETAAETTLEGRIVRIDRFGNLITDLPAAWLPDLETEPGSTDRPAPPGGSPAASGGRSAWRVELAGRVVARWVSHYAELPEGEPGALVGSLGTVELSLRGRSLAARWSVARGETVRIVLASPPG